MRDRVLILAALSLSVPFLASGCRRASESRSVGGIDAAPLGPVRSVAFSPDKNLVAAGYDSGKVAVFSVPSGARLQTFGGHRDWVNGLAFLPDGTTLVSASSDRTLKFWNTSDGKLLRTAEGAGYAECLALSPDGSELVSGYGPTVWDPAAGTKRRSLGGGKTHALSFSSDGSLLAAGVEGGAIRVWDYGSGATKLTLADAHPADREKRLDGFFQSGEIHAVAFAPDKTTLASGGFDGSVRLWDAETGRQIWSVRLDHLVYGVAFSPDSSRLAVAATRIYVRDGQTGSAVLEIPGHSGGFHFVFALTFSPDGRLIASGGADGTVHLWDATSGRQISKLM